MGIAAQPNARRRGDAVRRATSAVHDVEALLEAADAHAPTGLRNRVLVSLVCRCGLAAPEVVRLYPRDLDLSRNLVTVTATRGAKRRRMELDDATTLLLERWLARRHRLGISLVRPVICTLGGRPIDPTYVSELLLRLSRRAAIGGPAERTSPRRHARLAA